MNEYQKMIDKHQKEISAFPLVFGFGNAQIDEGMRKLGLDPSEREKVTSYFGVGDFLRITDVPALEQLLKRQREEREAAIAADKTGDGFIYDMLDTELSNHEYGYTRDLTDTLRAIGMKLEQVNADERFLRALRKASKEQIAFYEKTQTETEEK